MDADPQLTGTKRPADDAGDVDAAGAARGAAPPPPPSSASPAAAPPPPPGAEDVSFGQRHPADAARPDRGVPRATGGPAEAGPGAAAPAQGGGAATTGGAAAPAPAPSALVVPASASWFRYYATHALEKEALPEWFDGRPGGPGGPEAYQAVRNALVDGARVAASAGGALTFTAARAAAPPSTDAAALQRVHAFLEHWGIINYRPEGAGGGGGGGGAGGGAAAANRTRPPPALPGGGATVDAGARAPGADALFAFPAPSVAAGLAAAREGPGGGGGGGASAAAAAAAALLPLLGRRDRHGRPPPGEAPLPPGAPTRFFCSAMPWVDCTAVRYHCTRVPDVDLCPEAFADGRFPPGCTGRDFVRVEGGGPPPPAHPAAPPPPGVPARAVGSSDWSDQETLLLLEGVEVYGDDWAEVAEHVGSKSAAACLRRFLQLPIADSVAAALEAPGSAAGGATVLGAASRPAGEPVADGPGADPAAPRPPLPFADAGNPVIAQCAALAAMVGPRVAAAAARRALEVIAEEEAGGGGGGGGGGGAAAVPDATTRAAAAAGLAAAAVKARVLGDEEEKEALRMAGAAAAALAARIVAKVRALDDLGAALERERAALDAARDAAYAERRELEARRIAAGR